MNQLKARGRLAELKRLGYDKDRAASIMRYEGYQSIDYLLLTYWAIALDSNVSSYTPPTDFGTPHEPGSGQPSYDHSSDTSGSGSSMDFSTTDTNSSGF